MYQVGALSVKRFMNYKANGRTWSIGGDQGSGKYKTKYSTNVFVFNASICEVHC